MSEDLDVRCPACGIVMLPTELAGGDIVMQCRNCGQVQL